MDDAPVETSRTTSVRRARSPEPSTASSAPPVAPCIKENESGATLAALYAHSLGKLSVAEELQAEIQLRTNVEDAHRANTTRTVKRATTDANAILASTGGSGDELMTAIQRMLLPEEHAVAMAQGKDDAQLLTSNKTIANLKKDLAKSIVSRDELALIVQDMTADLRRRASALLSCAQCAQQWGDRIYINCVLLPAMNRAREGLLVIVKYWLVAWTVVAEVQMVYLAALENKAKAPVAEDAAQDDEEEDESDEE